MAVTQAVLHRERDHLQVDPVPQLLVYVGAMPRLGSGRPRIDADVCADGRITVRRRHVRSLGRAAHVMPVGLGAHPDWVHEPSGHR